MCTPHKHIFEPDRSLCDCGVCVRTNFLQYRLTFNKGGYKIDNYEKDRENKAEDREKEN